MNVVERGLRRASSLVGPRTGAALAVGAVGTAVASALASVATATYFARRVVTVEADQKDDTHVLEVGADTVTLRAEPHTLSPGRYGLWHDGGEAHVRVGEVLDTDLSPRRAADRTVVRELLGSDFGAPLQPGTGRWDAYYYAGDPGSALGLDYDDVFVTSDVGELPTWKVPPADEAKRPGAWAILVHGRSARRQETLRAVPVLHDLGFTCLIPMYRNDAGAPPSIDGRYNLGLSEWRDIEAAIRYALAHGAQDIVLFGWSMGGAVVLQTLDRSDTRDHVSKVVLDCPVIDWGDVLRHHADLNRIPRSAELLARTLMGKKATRHLVGVAEPIDIAITNWVARAHELRHPILLIHSRTDGKVPYGPSEELAKARPDLVQLDLWDGPMHCREWNTDPERWEGRVREFLDA
ncbi:MAG TPA: alpha/beta fold hydrolase [Ornithinicoccus sp.]|nr:alpha/beta fold hydrolase [Ornithinicoccus sp.]